MPPNEPGSIGYNAGAFMGWLINKGLGLARKVGLGLGLFNELRSELPDVETSLLGEATTIVGEGVRAGVAFGRGPPTAIVPLDTLPIVPASFFGDSETERVVALADVTFNDPRKGGDQTWKQVINTMEGATLQEIYDFIMSKLTDKWAQEYPEKASEFAIRTVSMFFMGRRF